MIVLKLDTGHMCILTNTTRIIGEMIGGYVKASKENLSKILSLLENLLGR